MAKPIRVYETRLIDLGLLDPAEVNPNEQTDAQFNVLVTTIQREAFTQPISVRPKGNGRYEIVGGHHRWRGRWMKTEGENGHPKQDGMTVRLRWAG